MRLIPGFREAPGAVPAQCINAVDCFGLPKGVGTVIDTFKGSMLHWRIARVALVLTVAGCVSSPTSVSRPPPDVSPSPDVMRPPDVVRPPEGVRPAVQTGQASWYGEQHHGQKTASGETYDMRQLTAAHRTLPMGTRLLVTNLRNGRTVEVRVNDRGPVATGRIIDLSYAAAEELGALSEGVFPVRIRVVSTPAR
jgi:rare lipoprotein A